MEYTCHHQNDKSFFKNVNLTFYFYRFDIKLYSELEYTKVVDINHET